MLYLVTGTPGSGKTLNTIKFINEKKQFHQINGTPRTVFYYNIRDLDPSFGWKEIDREQALKWFDLPSGSVIVFDESYDIFPAKQGGRQSPEHVMRLATHRHQGFDIFLITQKSTGQVDTFIRGLINRHHHYARIFGSKNVNRFSWDSCQSNTDSRAARRLSNTEVLRLDKKYFGKYHSADEHTHTLSLPKKEILLLLTLVPIVIYLFYLGLSPNTTADTETENSPGATTITRLQAPPQNKKMTFSELHTPTVKGLPWSAPVYEEVTQAKSWPRPAACIEKLSVSYCVCYTQQATKLYLDEDTCRTIVRDGFYDWTKEDPARISSTRAATAAGGEERRGGTYTL